MTDASVTSVPVKPVGEEATALAREIMPSHWWREKDSEMIEIWISATARAIQRAIDAAVAPVKAERDGARAAASQLAAERTAARTAAGELWAALTDAQFRIARNGGKTLAIGKLLDRHAAYAPKGKRS